MAEDPSDDRPASYPGGVTSSAPLPRVRQGRAIANDARILDAAEAILADDGWEDASVLRVAERADLSRRAVLNRYGDRAGVTLAAWTSRLAVPLRDALRSVVAARPAHGDPADAERIADALQPFLDPSRTMRAAAEVLIVSSFQPDVSQAVNSTLASPLEAWLTPSRTGLSGADAARNAALIALALGILLEARAYPDGLDMDITDDLARLAAALSRDVAPRRLPAERADYLDAEPVLDPDPEVAAMLGATLRLVGRDGYEAATIDRIAAECGHTSGFIFGHYPNKRRLFLDATARLLAQAEAQSHDFQVAIAGRHSPGIAEATLLREIMRSEHRSLRTIALEQYRLSWHDEDILDAFLAPRTTAVERVEQSEPTLTEQQARGRAFIGFARGIGYGLLAQFSDDAGALPHDVVAVPLVDEP